MVGGKSGQCIGLTTLLPSCVDCLEILGASPSGALRACTGIALPLLFQNGHGTYNIFVIQKEICSIWLGWTVSTALFPSAFNFYALTELA